MTNAEKIAIIKGVTTEKEKPMAQPMPNQLFMQGPAGYTPRKGIDFLTEDEMLNIIELTAYEASLLVEDGYTPVKGVDYFDGKDGADGKDGKDGKDGEDFSIEKHGYTIAEKIVDILPSLNIPTREEIEELVENKKEKVDYTKFATIDQLTNFLKKGGFRGGGSGGSSSTTAEAIPIAQWTANTAYKAGALLYEGTRIISRIADGTSGATFDVTEASNYLLVKSSNLAQWQPNTVYIFGEEAIYQNGLIRAVSTFLSPATFTFIESSNWISMVPGQVDWDASIIIYAGTTVTQGGRILKRNSTSLTNVTFDNTEAALYTFVSNNTIGNWTANTYYYTGEQVRSNGAIWEKKASGITTGIFDDIEILLWDLVSGSPYTSIPNGAYTVLETDDMIDLPGGATFVITIPANRVNPIIKFSTGALSATPPSIVTSGGETIIDPSTYASSTGFFMPGVATFASSVQFQKVGSQYRFIA